MTLLLFNNKLKHDDTGVIALARATHSGMAHWAGSGPALRTCRECRFWKTTRRFTASNGGGVGQPKPATCQKFKQLMCRRGDPVPHDAAACCHFELTDKPQALVPYEERQRRAGEGEP